MNVAMGVDNHQRLIATRACEGEGLSYPSGRISFKFLNGRRTIILKNGRNWKTSKKGTDAVRWLKWEPSEFETYDLTHLR